MHNACRTQDGNTANDTKARVPRFLRNFFAARNGNRNHQISRQTIFRTYLFADLCHHAARSWIDCRFARLNLQAGSRYGAYAFACLKHNACAGRGRENGRDDCCAVRDIRIVTRILDDTRHGIAFTQPFIFKLEIGNFTFGEDDADRIGEFTGNKRSQRCLGGSCGTGARRPAATQFGFFW